MPPLQLLVGVSPEKQWKSLEGAAATSIARSVRHVQKDCRLRNGALQTCGSHVIGGKVPLTKSQSACELVLAKNAPISKDEVKAGRRASAVKDAPKFPAPKLKRCRSLREWDLNTEVPSFRQVQTGVLQKNLLKNAVDNHKKTQNQAQALWNLVKVATLHTIDANNNNNNRGNSTSSASSSNSADRMFQQRNDDDDDINAMFRNLKPKLTKGTCVSGLLKEINGETEESLQDNDKAKSPNVGAPKRTNTRTSQATFLERHKSCTKKTKNTSWFTNIMDMVAGGEDRSSVVDMDDINARFRESRTSARPRPTRAAH